MPKGQGGYNEVFQKDGVVTMRYAKKAEWLQ